MKTNLTFPLVAFLALLLFSCKKQNVKIEEETSGGINKELMLTLVNNFREAGCNCGDDYYPPVAPIQWNKELEKSSQAHSDDMNDNSYFNHTGSDGSKAGDRIKDAGYNWKTYGENIAQGYSSESAVVNAWINSEGHCKNIMNGKFKDMGVAHSGKYWTMNLASK